LAKSPCGIVRASVVRLLTDQFNAKLLATVTDYPNLTAFKLDFNAPLSKSFFYGRMDIGTIEAATPHSETVMTYFAMQSRNRNLEKSRIFSGAVAIGIDLWLSYPAGRANQDFEAMPEAVEHALYQVFNAPGNARYFNSSSCCYNGDLAVAIGPLLEGQGKNWRRMIAATLTFEVVI
jgi:hypothetical protein